MSNNILNMLAAATFLAMLVCSSCKGDSTSTTEGETKSGYTSAPQYDSQRGTDQLGDPPPADTQKVNTGTGESK